MECLAFGPIELAPHLRLNIENNLVGNSCMYSTFIPTNPKGERVRIKGIRVNTRKSFDSSSQLQEVKEGKVLC